MLTVVRTDFITFSFVPLLIEDKENFSFVLSALNIHTDTLRIFFLFMLYMMATMRSKWTCFVSFYFFTMTFFLVYLLERMEIITVVMDVGGSHCG